MARINKNCITCKKEISVIPSRYYRTKYCSQKCRLNDWGVKSLAAQRPSYYKENAWRVYDKKCYDCGYNEYPEILLIHHKDGDRTNGSIYNLIPVCPNCHCIRHIKLTGDGRNPTYRRQKLLTI